MTKASAHLAAASCLVLACAGAWAQPVSDAPLGVAKPAPFTASPALEPVTFTGTVPPSLREQFIAQKDAETRAAKAKADAAAKSPASTTAADSSGVRSVEVGQNASNLGRTSLEFRELKRVESFVADIGPLGTAGRQQDASLRVPNDFGGLYQIPKDANTPYAGWFARRRGGLTAVFPKGDYQADKNGLYAVVPANTTYIMGAIQTGDAPQLAQNRAEPSGLLSTRQATAVPSHIRTQLTTRISDDDASLLLSGSSATPAWGPNSPRPDAPRADSGEQSETADKSATMETIFSGGVSRSVRLAELGRAAGLKRIPPADAAEPAPAQPPAQANPAVTTGQK